MFVAIFFFFFFSSRRRHTRFDCDWSSDVCSSDLIPGANLGDPNSSGMACANVPGAAGGGNAGCLVGYSGSLPWVRGETNIDAVNSWTMTRGNHTLKWGVDVRRVRDDLAQWQSQNPRGIFNFNDSVTSLKGGPKTSDQVNGFADFLLDKPNSVGRDVPFNS